jgi:hypothetical protein
MSISESFIKRIYTQQLRLSLNSPETTLRAIKLFNFLSRKVQKVNLILTILNHLVEKKTIVLDIDETLVYASVNRAE